jgi:hypothetical protein
VRHAQKHWYPASEFLFAASTSLVPLSTAEVGQATLAFPLAFIEREGHWTLAAVLGLFPAQNLYVDIGGKWLGRYVPAAVRFYPFLLGSQGNGDATLCIDEASGLVTEGDGGMPFFDEAGALNPTVTQITNFLVETARGEAVMAQASEMLAKAGVIEPWPITLQGDEGAQQVAGLHRVNEAALNGLDDATSNELRRAGVLGIAYAQLLSMGNLAQLGQLAQVRAQAEAAMRAKAEVKPLITLPENNTIDWDWSKVGR